jgi:hypothetical protein
MPLQPLLPLLLLTHISLAICLLLPSILLPFALRARRPAVESKSRVVRGLLVLQARGTLVIGIGLAITGTAMLLALGGNLIGQPWLLVALGIYAANLVVAFFIQRPNLRRLVGVRATFDDRIWQGRAQRQRYVAYVMAGLTSVIGLLMSAKPQLW